MSVECQVNVESQSELDIGGRETCMILYSTLSLGQGLDFGLLTWLACRTYNPTKTEQMSSY